MTCLGTRAARRISRDRPAGTSLSSLIFLMLSSEEKLELLLRALDKYVQDCVDAENVSVYANDMCDSCGG